MKTRLDKRLAGIEEAIRAGWDVEKIAHTIGCRPNTLRSARNREVTSSIAWRLLDPWLKENGYWPEEPAEAAAEIAATIVREETAEYNMQGPLSTDTLKMLGQRIQLVGAWLADSTISPQRRTDQLLDLMRDISTEIHRDRQAKQQLKGDTEK